MQLRLAAPLGQVGKGGVRVPGFCLDEMGHPLPEEVALVPAEVANQALGIAQHTPVVVHEIAKIQLGQDVANLFERVAEREQRGVDGTGRGTADALDAPQDALLFEHRQRTGIGDALDAATLKNEVAKRIPGLRHGRRLTGGDSEFDAEALRLAKLFQIAQHEKKPTRSWKLPARYPVTLHFFNPLMHSQLWMASAGGFLGLAGPMLKGG